MTDESGVPLKFDLIAAISKIFDHMILFGILFHFIGGFASGSFYIPYKKVREWSWESYWIVGGLFSWLIIPPLAAWLTVPHFSDIISQASAGTLGWTFFWGLLWGIFVFGDNHLAIRQDNIGDERAVLRHRMEHRQERQQPERRPVHFGNRIYVGGCRASKPKGRD